MFLVLVGRFSSTTGQTACAHADDFRLNAGGRRYDTTSGEMDAFKPLYKINYPGSVLGQCLARTESTFLVFDVPQMPGAAKLTFGSNTLDLGDLTALVRKSGFPLPGTENQLRPTLEKLLPPSARIASRLLEFKLTDAPSPAGAKLATVSWVIEDTGDAVKNKAALKSEATALFKTLYTTAGLTVAHVEVNASLRTFDVYGNPKDALVAKLALDSATAAKINWANFQADNLYAVAKIIALDPILKD